MSALIILDGGYSDGFKPLFRGLFYFSGRTWKDVSNSLKEIKKFHLFNIFDNGCHNLPFVIENITVNS